jgi:hypothetical protein
MNKERKISTNKVNKEKLEHKMKWNPVYIQYSVISEQFINANNV